MILFMSGEVNRNPIKFLSYDTIIRINKLILSRYLHLKNSWVNEQRIFIINHSLKDYKIYYGRLLLIAS